MSQHDHEVNEARWVKLDEAVEKLAFANEKKVVAKARAMIERMTTRKIGRPATT